VEDFAVSSTAKFSSAITPGSFRGRLYKARSGRVFSVLQMQRLTLPLLTDLLNVTTAARMMYPRSGANTRICLVVFSSYPTNTATWP
jgi:hypothetical protein